MTILDFRIFKVHFVSLLYVISLIRITIIFIEPTKGHCMNISTTQLQQWGFWQCLPFSWATLRGKHCRNPIAIMEVVDTFRHLLLVQILNVDGFKNTKKLDYFPNQDGFFQHNIFVINPENCLQNNFLLFQNVLETLLKFSIQNLTKFGNGTI